MLEPKANEAGFGAVETRYREAIYRNLSALFADAPSADALRVEVASKYAELFVGPRPPLAPYYESVYLGNPRRLFTEQTMSVRRFYERCGLSVVKDGKVPDDHVAYELELMATLAGREADAVESGRVAAALDLERLQREFLVVHLGGLGRAFRGPCRRGSHLEFLPRAFPVRARVRRRGRRRARNVHPKARGRGAR